jgi:hypothetical protein
MTRYTRLPSTGTVEPISSLNRTALDKLVRPQPENDFNPPVRTKILRTKGARRGTVLIEVESLLAYLASLPEDQPVRKLTPTQSRAGAAVIESEGVSRSPKPPRLAPVKDVQAEAI